MTASNDASRHPDASHTTCTSISHLPAGYHNSIFLSFLWCFSPSSAYGLPFRGFTITFRHTTVGGTPLDEESARRGDLYLTTLNIQKRQPSMPQAGFEPTIPATELPQIHALDRTTNGIGSYFNIFCTNYITL